MFLTQVDEGLIENITIEDVINKNEDNVLEYTHSYSDLRDKNDHPDKKISDHFPIVCEIKDKQIYWRYRMNKEKFTFELIDKYTPDIVR